MKKILFTLILCMVSISGFGHECKIEFNSPIIQDSVELTSDTVSLNLIVDWHKTR